MRRQQIACPGNLLRILGLIGRLAMQKVIAFVAADFQHGIEQFRDALSQLDPRLQRTQFADEEQGSQQHGYRHCHIGATDLAAQRTAPGQVFLLPPGRIVFFRYARMVHVFNY